MQLHTLLTSGRVVPLGSYLLQAKEKLSLGENLSSACSCICATQAIQCGIFEKSVANFSFGQ